MIFRVAILVLLVSTLDCPLPPPSDWWGVLSDLRTVSTVRVVLTLGLSCLLIYLSLGYAWRVFAFFFFFFFFCSRFIFSLPLRSDRGRFSRLLFFSSLSLLLFVFFGCSDGMEREACVCDDGFERSDLCAEIIIIIMQGHQKNSENKNIVVHHQTWYQVVIIAC